MKESDIKYVPCSGLAGENLTERSTVAEFQQWYSGPTFLEVIGKVISMYACHNLIHYQK